MILNYLMFLVTGLRWLMVKYAVSALAVQPSFKIIATLLTVGEKLKVSANSPFPELDGNHNLGEATKYHRHV